MDARSLRIIGTWATIGAALNFGLAWLMWGDRGVRNREQLRTWLLPPPPPPPAAAVK